MEALRESFLHLTFQMSYKRATLDEEDLMESTGDDVYQSSPMQVNAQTPGVKKKKNKKSMHCCLYCTDTHLSRLHILENNAFLRRGFRWYVEHTVILFHHGCYLKTEECG